MSTTRARPGLAAWLAACLLAGRLLAAPLSPGQALFPAPGEPDPAGGSVVAGGHPVPLTAVTFSGTLTTSVIAGDLSNPLGGLTFTFLLSNHAASANAISQLAARGFQGYAVDASFHSPGSGVTPAFIDRAGSGDVIAFNFLAGLGPGPLMPGSTSALLVIQTDARNYGVIPASVINGSVAEAASFAPSVEADFNHDLSVDQQDLAILQACATGPAVLYDPATLTPGCEQEPDSFGLIAPDLDRDGDIDMDDFGILQRCMSGPAPAHPDCVG